MRLKNYKYSLNRNLQNINTSYSTNNYSKERTIYSQSTKNIFSSKNPMYSTMILKYKTWLQYAIISLKATWRTTDE